MKNSRNKNRWNKTRNTFSALNMANQRTKMNIYLLQLVVVTFSGRSDSSVIHTSSDSWNLEQSGGWITVAPIEQIIKKLPSLYDTGSWHCLQTSICWWNSSICSVISKKLNLLWIFWDAVFKTVLVFTPGPKNERKTKIRRYISFVRLVITFSYLSSILVADFISLCLRYNKTVVLKLWVTKITRE